ncbi:MAG TPA: YHYH protein [Pseudomonadota bacterium]|nr:YHYH protein [Pseudomonadota bacterium]HNF96384.1 YHYH protein [Pseudomonadota bacterium]HNO68357.1 YHYH protein [Pseudomonadota bacterium]
MEYARLLSGSALATALVLTSGCGTSPSSMNSSLCQNTASTSATATVNPAGCAVLARDTSACAAERQAAGLTGYWLKFSCRVKLTKQSTAVQVESDGLPDYKSNYFASTDPCHENYTGGVQNPNTIATKSYAVPIPLSPTATSQVMTGAVVGMSINGVPVFANFAAPGDDIYREAMTFDRCGAHPTPTSAYHYHSEPYSISYNDSNFIGVMRDGYPIYGRKDPDGTIPTVDATGGHMGVTVDSPSTAVYHYHVNQQTSTTAGTAGQMQWFITKGSYHGTPAPCSTCM